MWHSMLLRLFPQNVASFFNLFFKLFLTLFSLVLTKIGYKFISQFKVFVVLVRAFEVWFESKMKSFQLMFFED